MKLAEFVQEGTCTQIPGEMFFSDAKGDHTADLMRPVCIACPVAQACFTWAMEQGPDLVGVWGGTTQVERGRAHRRAA